MRTRVDAPERPADVAMVIDTITRGGAERVLITIANGLDPHRFRVHVITTRDRGDFADALAPHVMVHSLNRRTRWDAAALRRFSRLIDALGIRIVHTHSHTAAYFVRLAALGSAPRWVHVMHDHHGPVENAPFLRLADRLLLRRVDYYFAVSDRLTRYAVGGLGIAPERCERLVNGVDVPDEPRASAANTFTVAHLARVSPEKGHELAIEVAARVRVHVPGLRWRCIGEAVGAHATDIRARARRAGVGDVMEFLGERSDVAALLRSADVGVITSRWEGLPMALLEYMAAGLPVVVTDVGDCGRVVREAGGGTVVAPEDVEAFSAALLALASDPAAAARAGDANRMHVREHHSSEAMVRRVSEVYDALLSNRIPTSPPAGLSA